MRTPHDDLVGVDDCRARAPIASQQFRLSWDESPREDLLPDPFRQWQNRVYQAQQRARREAQDAKMNLFQVGWEDGGYKPRLLPEYEINRLRQGRRTRWT